ncbi:MAG: class I SAM-dependent methyltransferase [Patescibacteria group bacterium]|nr:class I SAM-dependent methyltransferase [Patescibacteria group bacterium]
MNFAYKISKFNRNRKWKIFLDLIQPKAAEKILDLGFSDQEYSEFDNYLEKHYLYPENIIALSVEEPNEFKNRYPKVKALRYNGGKLPFSDKRFDIAWSNAVIEHVGSEQEQVIFLKELKRAANRVFITTPNRFFPIEVHTRIPILHWFPKRIFDFIIRKTNKKWATDGYMHLLSLSEIKKILAIAKIENYKIIKNKLFFFTLDYVIIF